MPATTEHDVTSTSLTGATASTSGSLTTISGLGTGLDDEQIIDQLVAVEQQKVTNVQAQAAVEQSALSSWSTIRSTLSTLQTAEQALVNASDWQLLNATSSDTTVATVSAGSGTMTGSLTFSVNSLASAGVLRSTNTVSSLSSHVTNNSTMLVAAGGGQLGFSSLAATSNVTLGSHSIAVTQSSAAATKNGTSALAASTVIDNSDHTLKVVVNGTTYNVTIASGTYDAESLAAAVQQALTNAGAPIAATVNTAGGLSLSTTNEGSAATVRVTGGTALASLHLTTDASALHGTDGIVTVDGGAAQTFGNVTPLAAGGTVTLSAGTGTITATLAGGLRAGTVSGTQVSTGDGSLQSVVAAINSANANVTAAAIQVGTNAYRLQVAATNTGAGNDPNIASSDFDPAATGGLTVLTQGTDAAITVGSGTGSYEITSTSNQMANVLPGVTLNLVSQSTSPITVTVGHDGTSLANDVQSIVNALNSAKSTIDNATAYDTSTHQASPLTGDVTAERLESDLHDAVSNIVGGANPVSPGIAGISVDDDGNYTFDSTAFMTAYNADPSGVTKLFAQSGSATSGSLSFVSATNGTRSGTYAVNITAAASQGKTTSAGLPAVGTTIRAQSNGVTASYTVQAGDTLTTVAAGLNSAFAAQNTGLVASVSGSNLQINTARYGSQATMQVAWTGSTYTSYSGTDVAGTINGVAAQGFGQTLAAPQTDPTLAGLAINVTGTTTGNIGSLTYTPGIAARLDQTINDATDSLNGYITASENGHKANVQLIDDRVTQMSDSVNDYQNRLKNQFAQLEAVLAQMKNQSSFLSSEIAQL
jgi:flagellar hook-associated protein 2